MQAKVKQAFDLGYKFKLAEAVLEFKMGAVRRLFVEHRSSVGNVGDGKGKRTIELS